MVYRPKVNAKLCFVALPLRKPFTDYYNGIIKPAIAEAGLTAITSEEIYGTGPIIQDIWDHIWTSAIVIADVTNKNPNVNYELGLCHAIGVPTIIISQSIDDVPFDYRHRRCILYDTTEVDWQAQLRQAIKETTAKVLSGEPPEDELRWPYDTSVLRETKRIGAFVTSEDATADVIRGARLVRDAVVTSYGPHGVTVSFRIRGQERQLRKGAAIANNTWSPNRLEMAGITAMRQVGNSMSERVGDGTKLAIILAEEFIERGYAVLKTGCLLRDLMHGMDTAIEKAITLLKDQSKTVADGELLAVAKTAAGGDEHLAKLVGEAMRRAGSDGIVVVEGTSSLIDEVEVIEGMQFDQGYLSEEFITEPRTTEAVMNDAYVLICGDKLSLMRPLLPLLNLIAQANKPLLIIAEDVDGEALATLILNKKKGTLLAIPVRSPGFGERRRAILEDIAVTTGGTVISSDSAIGLRTLSLAQLGRAKKITVTKDKTVITEGAGSGDAIRARAQIIKNQIEHTRSDNDREKLQERLAKLTSAICFIKIGSEGDWETRRYRAENAMFACRAALDMGVIPGGGAALFHVQEPLLSMHIGDQGRAAGFEVIAFGCTAALEAQANNSKVNFNDILSAFRPDSSLSLGFNAEARKVEDLYQNGVIDPTKVIIDALRVAFAKARAVLQTGAWGQEEINDSELQQALGGKAPDEN